MGTESRSAWSNSVAELTVEPGRSEPLSNLNDWAEVKYGTR